MDWQDLNENRFHALLSIAVGAYLAFVCSGEPAVRALFAGMNPLMLIFVGLGVVALTYWNSLRDDEVH